MGSSVKIFTVAEISKRVKGLLESELGEVWVEGEISGFKVSSLGHVYLDLKDSQAVISCVIFKNIAAYIKFRPENGLLVKVRAFLTSYSRQSKYQLNVREIIPGDYGPLQLAFEQLKKKLLAEGLFDDSRKKEIPKFPEKIAVLTSLHGAAIKDILSVIKRRYADIRIIIAPVKVQGDGAAEDIADKIGILNRSFSDIDAMLIGRGGGSMEDLWAFNEEILARAIADSKIPVISCVGHETDFTIADFVADLRAPTPSAAAELVVSNKEEIRKHLFQLKKRLSQSLQIVYENLSGRFLKLASARVFREPRTLLEPLVQRLDEASENIAKAADLKVKNISSRLDLAFSKLNAFSPYFPLRKGYSIVRLYNGKVLRTSKDLKNGDTVDIEFAKGKALAEIKEISEN